MSESTEGPGRPTRDQLTIDLLRRYRQGDPRALDEILRRNLRQLSQWATGRLPAGARDRGDTEDLVQETILHALPRLADFDYRGPGAIQAYLRGAILNHIRNEYRRVGRRPRSQMADSDLRYEAPSPLEEAIGRDAVEDYETALAGLDDLDRELVILRLELDYSYQEIAEATGRPTADAARMATGRALLRLARSMRHGKD